MKRFFSVILTIIISILICLLCISYGIKDACINTISNVIVKGEITSKIVLSVKNVYPNASYEALEDIENAIGNNSSVNELTTKYFDEIVNSITSDKKVKAPNTREELLSLINDNEMILKEHGVIVTEEQKDKIVNEIVESNIVNDVYEKISTMIKKDLNDNQKKAADLYKLVISNDFRLTLILLIVIITILIMVIKRSFYRFSINLGIASLLSGIIVTFIFPFVVNMLEEDLTYKLIGESAKININMLTNYGYICFVFASLFMIVYFIGNKIVKNKEELYLE